MLSHLRQPLLLSALVLLVLAGCTSEKERLDAQVDKLCAIDGGIKVYEKALLPPESFNKYGNVDIPSKRFAKPSDEYYRETERVVLVKGNPRLRRTEHKIIRRRDGKVMGVSVRYGRGGGDLPGPWHPSSYTCPPIISENPSLTTSIFIKEKGSDN